MDVWWNENFLRCDIFGVIQLKRPIRNGRVGYQGCMMFCMLYLINVFTSLVTSAAQGRTSGGAGGGGSGGSGGSAPPPPLRPLAQVLSEQTRGQQGQTGLRVWRPRNKAGRTEKKVNLEREVLPHFLSAICFKMKNLMVEKTRKRDTVEG